VLIHLNLITVLSKDVSSSLKVLTLLFEAKRKERVFDECVDIIYLALRLLKGADEGQKETWIVKFLDMLLDIPAGNLTANLIFHANQRPIEDRILLCDHRNSLLYILLKMGSTPSPMIAEQSSLALIEVASALKNEAEKLAYIQMMINSVAIKFKSFPPQNLGFLLMSALTMAIEFKSAAEVSKLCCLIAPHAQSSGFFSHSQSIGLLKQVLGNYEVKWMTEMNVVADMVRNIPECHIACAERLKIRLKFSAEDSGKVLLKLGLLIQNSIFLKHHLGFPFVRETLVSLVEACKEDMSSLLDLIFEECFTHDDLPKSLWTILLDTLIRCPNESKSKTNGPLIVAYISSHMNTPEQRQVNIWCLLYLLQNFSRYIQREVVDLLLHPKFFDHFLEGDKRENDDWILCCRLLLQYLVANFHEVFEGEIMDRWGIYKPKLFDVLAGAQSVSKTLNAPQGITKFQFINATCTFFVDATEVGRWGSNAKFDGMLPMLDETFSSATVPANAMVIYENLRCFYANLPVERKRIAVDKILNWAANALEYEVLLDGTGMVFGTMDELLAAYSELHTSEELMNAACTWAKSSSVIFAGMLSEPMVNWYN
jgi:hypothetical protein